MVAGTILRWFHPFIDAFVARNVPFHYRWRLLLFQPLAVLIYLINTIPTIISRRSSVIHIPVRNGRHIRSLVYHPPGDGNGGRHKLRPLHLDVHGGGFIGGHPEAGYRFCTEIADRTGAVVVSTTYRFAPKDPFPAAIDDVDDVVSWLLKNAKEQFQADPEMFTMSGSSAGGNLALATAMKEDQKHDVKGVITFYAPIDLTLPPEKKSKPPNFPKWDPISFLMPMYDAYAGPARAEHIDNPRLSPAKAQAHELPDKILMVIPMIDILLAEQLQFAERVNRELESKGQSKKVEVMVMERCFHGWLELPSSVIDVRTREQVFERSVTFLRDIHRGDGLKANLSRA